MGFQRVIRSKNRELDTCIEDNDSVVITCDSDDNPSTILELQGVMTSINHILSCHLVANGHILVVDHLTKMALGLKLFNSTLPIQQLIIRYLLYSALIMLAYVFRKQYLIQMETNKENNQQEGEKEGLQELKKLEPRHSIQDAFKRFQKQKFYQLKLNQYLKHTNNVDRSSPQFQENLRKKFVETAKKYIGVPYKKSFHKEGDALYDSPLFLDCCGLVRQVVFDLRSDFGFALGKWNQAYQFDTLPDEKLTEEQLKPGDLIFYSATYYNTKIKPFPHKMVHVEIYMGEGRSLGARWQKGTVREFDSYKFVSTLYHDIEIHYRSINKWLEGVCESQCSEHKWLDDKATDWVSDKFSVFADPLIDEIDVQKQEEILPKKAYVGKGNNPSLVKKILESKGFPIMADKEQFSPHYYLRWVQTSSEVDYFSFKEGKQLVNHIPNLNIITVKTELLSTLNEFGSKAQQMKIKCLEVLPKTYRLDVMTDEIEFINDPRETLWIYKPRNCNQGKGIQLISDIRDFKNDFLKSKKFYLGEYTLNNMIYYKPELNPATKEGSESKYANIKHDGLIQHYLTPHLIDGYKFDIRCYLLINSNPELALFSPGYLRLTLDKYSEEDFENQANLFKHLTNNCYQRKHKDYKSKCEETIRGWDALTQSIGSEATQTVLKSIKKLLLYVYLSAQKKIDRKQGLFELLGCDILLDSNLRPYLLEVNTNPAIFLDTKTQKEVIPPVVESTIDIVTTLFKDPSKVSEVTQNCPKPFEVIYQKSKHETYLSILQQ